MRIFEKLPPIVRALVSFALWLFVAYCMLFTAYYIGQRRGWKSREDLAHRDEKLIREHCYANYKSGAWPAPAAMKEGK